jgi:hypothetical protein
MLRGVNLGNASIGSRDRPCLHVIEPHRRATFEVHNYQYDNSDNFDYISRNIRHVALCLACCIFFGVGLFRFRTNYYTTGCTLMPVP